MHERVMIVFKTCSSEIITHLGNIDGYFHHISFISAIFSHKSHYNTNLFITALLRISIQRFEQAFYRLSFSNVLHYR